MDVMTASATPQQPVTMDGTFPTPQVDVDVMAPQQPVDVMTPPQPVDVMTPPQPATTDCSATPQHVVFHDCNGYLRWVSGYENPTIIHAGSDKEVYVKCVANVPDDFDRFPPHLMNRNPVAGRARELESPLIEEQNHGFCPNITAVVLKRDVEVAQGNDPSGLSVQAQVINGQHRIAAWRGILERRLVERIEFVLRLRIIESDAEAEGFFFADNDSLGITDEVRRGSRLKITASAVIGAYIPPGSTEPHCLKHLKKALTHEAELRRATTYADIKAILEKACSEQAREKVEQVMETDAKRRRLRHFNVAAETELWVLGSYDKKARNYGFVFN